MVTVAQSPVGRRVPLNAASHARWPCLGGRAGVEPAAEHVTDAAEQYQVADHAVHLISTRTSPTLMEAIAEGFRLDRYGGRASARTGRPNPTKTPLGEILTLDLTAAGSAMMTGPRLKKKGFFLRAETAFSMTEQLGGVPGYWTEDTAAMSHGEGFLTVFQAMMNAPGFYVMDEPESALSFTACLHLTALVHQLGGSGAQVVYATHSPISEVVCTGELVVCCHVQGTSDLRDVPKWPALRSLPFVVVFTARTSGWLMGRCPSAVC